jgi:malate dehydrogenase
MTRSDLVGVNSKVIRSIASQLKGNLPKNSPVLVVTNPLDSMTHLAAGILGGQKGQQRRVIGMAGALDSARLERSVQNAISRKYRVPASKVGQVSATVLGTHGDEMVPLLSRLKVDGVPASRLLSSQELGRAVRATQKMGGTITRLVGRSAAMAPGACVAKMVTSIATNRGDVVPASVSLKGEYGLKNVSLGVPVRLGRTGATVVKSNLAGAERAALRVAADKVRRDIRAIP